MPHFFIYAKDKDISQVEEANDSFVNKLYKYVINPRTNFKFDNLFTKWLVLDYNQKSKKIAKPKYVYLMTDKSMTSVDSDVIDVYKKISKEYNFKISSMENTNPEILMKTSVKVMMFYGNAIRYIKETMSKTGYTDEQIADILVLYLYENDLKGKQILWTVYGDILLSNLKKNINCLPNEYKTKPVQCVDCGEWFEVSVYNSATCRCDECRVEHNRKMEREKKRRQRNK